MRKTIIAVAVLATILVASVVAVRTVFAGPLTWQFDFIFGPADLKFGSVELGSWNQLKLKGVATIGGNIVRVFLQEGSYVTNPVFFGDFEFSGHCPFTGTIILDFNVSPAAINFTDFTFSSCTP